MSSSNIEINYDFYLCVLNRAWSEPKNRRWDKNKPFENLKLQRNHLLKTHTKNIPYSLQAPAPLYLKFSNIFYEINLHHCVSTARMIWAAVFRVEWVTGDACKVSTQLSTTLSFILELIKWSRGWWTLLYIRVKWLETISAILNNVYHSDVIIYKLIIGKTESFVIL